MNTRHARRRMMSEINVVPYIDVMLVLLIIFMVTAPLITQGVRIELPQAPSEVLPPSDQEPIVVSVAADGSVYIDIGENPDQAVDEDTLSARVTAVMQARPATEVLVEGDRSADYGRVVEIMTVLKNAGVRSVGLITEPPE